MSSNSSATDSFPGAGLLHPLPIAAMALLILNDHWLKYASPGWLTGKLSDVAGLVFFPLFLQSLWELGLTIGRRSWRPSRTVLIACMVTTAIVFSLVKCWPPATETYRWSLGALQWPAWAMSALVRGRAAPSLHPVDARLDPTDLLALPAILLAFLPARSRS